MIPPNKRFDIFLSDFGGCLKGLDAFRFFFKQGCISVVHTIVRERTTPDSRENKQADAGSRLFSKAFSERRVVVELFISRT